MSSRKKPTSPPSKPDPSLEDWRPKQIGPYRILEVLGEGGMGTVYLAEQIEPIRRRVALKLIKLGQDTKEVLARFEQERQALSMMNHPCIAQVFDAGATGEGRPYYVMEVVDGIRITRYCDEHRLSVRDRLELFMQVCAGIQHAHQKGIIHRDLKPSNVLVTVTEEGPVPKIIDFGLALSMEQKLIEQTLLTRQGQWIGTPEYMSPEQAGSGADIDTRADIYSLGVVLYELLTGRLPFESWLLHEAGLAEIQRAIQEQEPPKPSSKVAAEGAAMSESAERRGTDPATLRRRLRGDLDWIVMKALEKDRARRYASASELAADIQRHLDHEPAIAGPPSWGYRTRKFLRRHRLQVTAAAAVLVSLVAGIIVAVSQYRRAEASATLARQREADAKRQKAVAQGAAAEAERSAAAATRARDLMAQQQQIAEREARRSQDMLDKFKFLTYVTRLDEAKEAARQLYPAWPEQADALRAWLRKARLLRNEVPKIRSALLRIEARKNSSAEHFQGRLEDLDKTLERVRDLVPTTFLNDAVGLFGDLRRQEGLARLRLLEDIWVDGFLHDMLVRLIRDLEDFDRGELRDVRNRLFWATHVQRLSIDEHGPEWARARAAIASPTGPYGGLDLRPQVGLVPLGPDPRTGLEEFVHLRSGTRGRAIPARDPVTGQLRITPDTGIVFVLVPAGTLALGAQGTDPAAPGFDPGARAGESPVRRLRLAAFFASKYELTQGQWVRLAASNPSVHGPEGTRETAARALLRPVENVSWEEARGLVRQLGLALPTEAQWEYLARAGTATPWPTGRTPASLAGAANLADPWWQEVLGPGTDGGAGDGHPTTAPVGSFRPNGLGLHDVCGNVQEWCRDLAGSYDEPMAAGDGWRERGRSRNAVIRGGSWRTTGREARSAFREVFQVDNRSDAIGLRPVRRIME